MTYALIVVFYLNGVDQPPVFMNDLLPGFFDTYSECEDRRERAEVIFENSVGLPPFHLACYQILGQGEAT